MPISGRLDAVQASTATSRPSQIIKLGPEARLDPLGNYDWIGCHVGLFAFLGGVTTMIVCDNLKAAVTNPDRYDPGINRSYQEMAGHYGVNRHPRRALARTWCSCR